MRDTAKVYGGPSNEPKMMIEDDDNEHEIQTVGAAARSHLGMILFIFNQGNHWPEKVMKIEFYFFFIHEKVTKNWNGHEKNRWNSQNSWKSHATLMLLIFNFIKIFLVVVLCKINKLSYVYF